MPVPSAVMIAWTSVFFSTRSMRAFSTLMILPRSGRMAWNIESRPLLAEPPAESPSTTYSSDCVGSVERQSASLPGRPPMSVALLRRTSSRALRAAITACADETALFTTVLASAGLASNQWVQLLVADLLDERLDLGVAELGLGLALELRLGRPSPR